MTVNKRGATVFYTGEFKKECPPDQVDILNDVIADDSLPRSASKEINHYCFKTPMNVVLTKQEPERKFVDVLVDTKVCEKIDGWIKSRDQNFYSIEYSWRKGEHPTQGNFNPDFFIKMGMNIVVIEIKSDKDDSDENKAKHRWARQYFAELNKELKKSGIQGEYIFHFLSPESYSEFGEYLLDGRLLRGEFRSALEDLLEK